MPDPTQRFSDRVDDYVATRPSYPPAVLETLHTAGLLHPSDIIADLGSGTGILAKLFLDSGNMIYGVEPNPQMRAAGEAELRGYPRFQSVDGRAEQTGLPDLSVDGITAGQAFHWFDPAATRAECRRILRPNGWVALIWNERIIGATPFLHGYEDLLQRLSSDYESSRHRSVPTEAIESLFGVAGYAVAEFSNHQSLDEAGVVGRARSSSYVPAPGHPNHDQFFTELVSLFRSHQENGEVRFEYITRMYYGRLS